MPLNLLDLPSELLDHIVELVVTYQDSSPTTASGDRLVWPRESENGSAPPQCSNNVKYHPDHILFYHNWKCASATLLLTNRRVAEITRRKLTQLSKSRHYVLDVMLVNETDFWPTWTFLTPPSQFVDSFKVTFRTTGTSPTLDGRKFRFGDRDWGPPQIIWCLFYLLERFAESGPLAEHQPPKTGDQSRYQFKTRELTLDVITPFGLIAPSSMEYENWLDGHNSKDPRTSYTWPYNTVETLMIRPEWLVNLISYYIDRAFDMTDSTNFFGDVLKESVETIRVCLNGSPIKEHSIDRHLKEYIGRIEYEYSPFPAKMAYYSLHMLMERRKKAGLSDMDYREQVELLKGSRQ